MTESRKSGGLLTLLGNAALLLCAVVGFVGTFLSLYSTIFSPFTLVIPDSFIGSPAQLTLAAIPAALVSLAVWSLPKHRAPVVCFLTALLVAAAFRHHVRLIAGAKLTFQAVANLFSEKVGWTQPVKLTTGLVFAQDRLDAILLFLTAVTILLALLLGWMVVRSRRWWMVMLLTLPPLLPGLLAEVPFDWTCFLMLAACWCSMLLGSLCKWSAGRGVLTLVTLPAVGLLLGALLLISPPEDYVQPEWTAEVKNDIAGFANRHFPSLNSGEGILDLPSDPTGPAFPTFVGSVASVDLSSAGPLNYSGRTVLRVSGDYTGRVYLRGAASAQYTGSSWEPPEEGAYEQYLEDRSQDIPPLLLPSQSGSAGAEHTITVQNVGASAVSVYLPYQLAMQDFDALDLVFVDDQSVVSSTGKRRNTVTFLPGSLELKGGMDSFLSGPVYAIAGDWAYLSFVEEHYGPSTVPPELAELFDSLLAELLLLSASSDSYGEAYDHLYGSQLTAVKGVAALLDELCGYNPATPLTPETEDFVEYFLTESRQGYCMHFASAATLMLRYLDVPARYVSGFVADMEAGRTVNVPDYTAHAWVEVYLPGYGWYPVEVTPGYEGEGNPAAPEAEGSPAPSSDPQPSVSPSTPPLEPSPSLPSDQPSPQPASTPSVPVTEEEPPPSTRLLPVLAEALKWLAPAAGALLLLWLGQYLPKRRRRKRMNAVNTNQAALDCYRWLTRLTRWGGLVDPTALELAQKARFSQHLLTEEERMMMAVLFHDERRRIGGRLSPIPGLLFRYLWGVPRD